METTPTMPKKLIQLTDELWVAIDEARGIVARNPWLEDQLWRLASVRQGAADAGVKRRFRMKQGGLRQKGNQ